MVVLHRFYCIASDVFELNHVIIFLAISLTCVWVFKLKNFILIIKIHASTGCEIYYSLKHMKMNKTMLFSIYIGSMCRKTCFEVS